MCSMNKKITTETTVTRERTCAGDYTMLLPNRPSKIVTRFYSDLWGFKAKRSLCVPVMIKTKQNRKQAVHLQKVPFLPLPGQIVKCPRTYQPTYDRVQGLNRP